MNKPGFVLYREGCQDEADVCDTLDDVRDILQERRDDNGDYFDKHILPQMRVYALTGEPISITFTPAVLTLGDPTDIPPPLPGETVWEYAQRITGG